MEFQYENTSGGSPDSISKNDRLAKAIARNRAKRALRDGVEAKSSSDFGANLGGGTSKTSLASRARTTSLPSGSPSRVSVGRVDDVNFVAPTVKKRLPKKSLTTAYTRKPKKKKNMSSLATWAYKFAWGFCGFLLLRLVFSEGGVIDYYSKQDRLTNLSNQYQSIVNENNDLRAEIKMIKNDVSHQKKIVREFLGYIAKDEFLILFPKGDS